MGGNLFLVGTMPISHYNMKSNIVCLRYQPQEGPQCEISNNAEGPMAGPQINVYQLQIFDYLRVPSKSLGNKLQHHLRQDHQTVYKDAIFYF